MSGNGRSRAGAAWILWLALASVSVLPARADHNPDEIRWCSMRVNYRETIVPWGPLYNRKELHGLAAIQCPGSAPERFVFSAVGISWGAGLASDSSFHVTPEGIEGQFLVGVPGLVELHGLIDAFRQDGSIGNAEAAALHWRSPKGHSIFFPSGVIYPSLQRDGRIGLVELRLVYVER